jgi:large subunit ribosomal protein L29
MLAKDIREMGEADINARIAELQRERFNLRVQSGTRTLDDPLRLRVIRRDVARLKTVLKEKVIGLQFAEGKADAGRGTRDAKGGKREAAHGGRTSRRVTGRRGRKAATATNRAKRSKRA